MKHYHFVGIGGARLSALAKLYYDRGIIVSGSDTQESKVVQKLKDQGIKFYQGHQAENIAGADLVVYTNAVGNENPEVLAAQEKGIALIEGAELLGQLMSEVGQGIAIAGTHGKTTTSSMTALVLAEGGVDPTVLIGGEIAAFKGNHRTGKSPYMVVEACEFKRSFLYLRPTIELITNVDWDHPDCFPTMDDVMRTFIDFVELLPLEGKLLLWGDDPNALKLQEYFSGKVITFGYQTHFDWSLNEIRQIPPLGIAASLSYQGKAQGELRLQVPGRHNLQNALGAVAIAAELGVPLENILTSLSNFAGVGRRFEIKGSYQGAMVVDDYAHHPSAIRTTLAAARQAFSGKIWCVFQPHLYSRTKYLLKEFIQAFNDADVLVLADIYAAREKDPGDISSQDLANGVINQGHQQVQYLGNFENIIEYLKNNVKTGDLIITMGAGDIWKVGEKLASTAGY